MKRILLGLAAVPFILIPFILIILLNSRGTDLKKAAPVLEDINRIRTITGIIHPGDTMETIFGAHNLHRTEMSQICDIARHYYNLSKLSVGAVYFFDVDRQNRVHKMQYEIDDRSLLKVVRTNEKFNAETVAIKYTVKFGSLSIKIKDNLIASMPSPHKEYLKLALDLSDIYAWDIDFSSDIRNNDALKVIVEELWVGNVFKGFGNILAAEFLNNGHMYDAYRFERDGYADYYDRSGKSLRKALLRSPLKFKHISSYFSRSRFHPVLRIYRPHLGVDYAAPAGTPVSAAGSGRVMFAGYKGQYGNAVVIKHNGGYETYYGHLSRIPRNIKSGVKISQNDIIGYVGSTGIATGPHLDYRIKFNGKFTNPLKIKLPRSESVPVSLMAEFRRLTDFMGSKLASLEQPVIARADKAGKST